MKTPTVISVLAFCADFWICSEHRTVGQKKKKIKALENLQCFMEKCFFCMLPYPTQFTCYGKGWKDVARLCPYRENTEEPARQGCSVSAHFRLIM